MQLSPHVFWRLSLAEWRAMLEGYAQRQMDGRYQQAWTVSYLLVAAGCDADKVTPEKLLGIKERRPRKPKPKLSPSELFARMRRVDVHGRPIAVEGKAEEDGR